MKKRTQLNTNIFKPPDLPHFQIAADRLSDFTANELERLKKLYNQSTQISKHLVKKAFEQAARTELPYIIFELKTLIKKENP